MAAPTGWLCERIVPPVGERLTDADCRAVGGGDGRRGGARGGLGFAVTPMVIPGPVGLQ
ncbi:MAG: hypothetical protein AVDCRST_MAG19-2220 [uncultured Thermomicrobiales bacterium]|uniref:Uncharacterized protein n=1 Tax=uncultured Thermomicrobiales bacterium TaxID=1645740 RepID=A0A6J4V3B5_9BACT|nr:MAG: hypothetical protein AVDCRST_MAG19-2220 [uncultured Thermomicrobiales bacterium]